MGNYSFECSAASYLLCTEANDLCFFDSSEAIDDLNQTPRSDDQNIGSVTDRSEPWIDLPFLSEDSFGLMVERERDHLPKGDYLKRLRSGDLDLGVRREALDWILKAHAHYSFGPLSVCLSMNYLDRFLSNYELPRGKSWAVQLLAVACLSLATKMEEPNVPLSVDLQVGEPKFVFEGKTIQRMELMVLSTLNWRMQASTPCSFIDYFLRLINDDQVPSMSLFSRSVQLILTTIRGIDFLEFRPSEIAASVAMCVSGELQALNVDKAMSSFRHVDKGRVNKCIELIQDLSMSSGGKVGNSSSSSGGGSSVPQSPNGVLEIGSCLSYKSSSGSDDGGTVGSCANSSSHTTIRPLTKRRRLQHTTPSPPSNLDSSSS